MAVWVNLPFSTCLCRYAQAKKKKKIVDEAPYWPHNNNNSAKRGWTKRDSSTIYMQLVDIEDNDYHPRSKIWEVLEEFLVCVKCENIF